MKSIDHSKTIMYKLVPKNLKLHLVYVGHTTNFISRKSEHKGRCNRPTDRCYNLKVYQIIRDNGGWNEWQMIEIEKYPCNDGNEARTRERYWYEFYNANLNTVLPISTQQEYSEKNRVVINAKQLKYYHKNKNVINKKRKEKRDQKKLSLDML
jgi:hypothetical protein